MTAAAVLIVGAALVAGAFWLVRAHRSSLTSNVETTARVRSQDIESSIADGSFPRTFSVQRGDENLVQVVDANGQVVAASRNLTGDARISYLQPGPSGLTSRTVAGIVRGDGPYRVVARRVSTPTGTYTVYAFRD